MKNNFLTSLLLATAISTTTHAATKLSDLDLTQPISGKLATNAVTSSKGKVRLDGTDADAPVTLSPYAESIADELRLAFIQAREATSSYEALFTTFLSATGITTSPATYEAMKDLLTEAGARYKALETLALDSSSIATEFQKGAEAQSALSTAGFKPIAGGKDDKGRDAATYGTYLAEFVSLADNAAVENASEIQTMLDDAGKTEKITLKATAQALFASDDTTDLATRAGELSAAKKTAEDLLKATAQALFASDETTDLAIRAAALKTDAELLNNVVRSAQKIQATITKDNIVASLDALSAAMPTVTTSSPAGTTTIDPLASLAHSIASAATTLTAEQRIESEQGFKIQVIKAIRVAHMNSEVDGWATVNPRAGTLSTSEIIDFAAKAGVDLSAL